MLVIIEVPNDATLAAHLMWLGSQGNLRTQTVKAFTEDEFRGIVGKLPSMSRSRGGAGRTTHRYDAP